ncbi:MAG TPA: hypothetical protein VGC87_05515 [Pyrinomonadaceae bacterium]|jgi:hypothetical protein
MKLIRLLSLSLSLVLCGTPLAAAAETAPGVFTLPEGRVAEAYHADIEAVLRERYQMKVETGVRNSILQWSLLDGELPPGLTVRTDGTLDGVPKSYREQPYQFTVKVIDMSVNDSGPLVIPLSLSVTAPRLRLTRLNGPTLVPLAPTAGERVSSADAAEAHTSASSPQRNVAAAAPLPRPANLLTPAPTMEELSGAAVPALLTPAAQGRRGVISRMAGLFGLGQDRGARRGAGATTGCTSGRHAVESDEAHNPLEGDTSTQNTCVEFTNLNPIKYRYEFNEKRTTSAGPDISSLPFLAKITPTATSAVTPSTSSTPSPTSPAVASLMAREGKRDKPNEDKEAKAAAAKLAAELQLLNTRFNEVRNNLNLIESHLRMEVEDPINQRVAEVQNAHQASVRLANSADLYLQSNNTAGLLTEVDTVWGELGQALTRTWPVTEIANVLSDLNTLTSQLEDLRFDNNGTQDVSQEAWAEWLASNQDRYSRVRDRIAELKAKVNTINEGADEFNESKNVLKEWQSIVNNVHNQRDAAFRQNVFVSCHNDEGENQSSKLSISKTDRTAANQAATTREVLTVNCYSRVAFTAGFNFSTLDEKVFSVVQAAGDTPGTVTKEFGFTSRSAFRPNPLLLLNVRFTDNPVYNWHASFGTVVDLQGDPGTDIEPVGGVSFSIRRLMFITPFAVHIGRVNRLAGGFNIGDVVPTEVATPPIEKAWKIGYTAGVTFRIAPQ